MSKAIIAPKITPRIIALLSRMLFSQSVIIVKIVFTGGPNT